MLTAIVVAIIVAAVSPLVAALVAPIVADWRRERVLKRLAGEQLWTPGVTRVDVRSPNFPDVIHPNALLESLDKGRVVFRWEKDGVVYRTPYTGAEVEALGIDIRE